MIRGCSGGGARSDEKALEWRVTVCGQHCGCFQCNWCEHLHDSIEIFVISIYHNKNKEQESKASCSDDRAL